MEEEKVVATVPGGTLNEAEKKDVDDVTGAKDHDNGVGQPDPGQWTKKDLRRYFHLLGKLAIDFL